MQLIDKNTMIKTIPETKENVLENILNSVWVFRDNPDILKAVLMYVEKGWLAVDVSNLQNTSNTWDACLRIKVNKAMPHYSLLSLIGAMVTKCRPDEMSMESVDVIRFWWD